MCSCVASGDRDLRACQGAMTSYVQADILPVPSTRIPLGWPTLLSVPPWSKGKCTQAPAQRRCMLPQGWSCCRCSVPACLLSPLALAAGTRAAGEPLLHAVYAYQQGGSGYEVFLACMPAAARTRRQRCGAVTWPARSSQGQAGRGLGRAACRLPIAPARELTSALTLAALPLVDSAYVHTTDAWVHLSVSSSAACPDSSLWWQLAAHLQPAQCRSESGAGP